MNKRTTENLAVAFAGLLIFCAIALIGWVILNPTSGKVKAAESRTVIRGVADEAKEAR